MRATNITVAWRTRDSLVPGHSFAIMWEQGRFVCGSRILPNPEGTVTTLEGNLWLPLMLHGAGVKASFAGCLPPWGFGFLYDGLTCRGPCHTAKCLGKQDKGQLPTGCLLSLAVFQSNLTPGTQTH